MGFYAEFSKHYDAIFPAKETQLHFFQRLFADEGVQRVLDVACGTGNYALAFADWGITVHGIDLEPSMVQAATQKANGLQVGRASFAVRDMRSLTPPDSPFDAVVCIGNSLAHLLSKEDLTNAVAGFAAQLRQDGICVIQLVNYDQVLAKHQIGLPTITNDAFGVSLERYYDYRADGLLDFRTVLGISTGKEVQRFQNVVALNPLHQKELDAILLKCGFAQAQYFGDFQGSDFRQDSSALVAIARKKRQHPS